MALSVPLGGDVPACVCGRPVLMRGDGDLIETPASETPQLHAVLVTPDVPCPTGDVFRRFDELSCPPFFEELPPPEAEAMNAFISELAAGYSNDLFAPALELVPVIGEVLEQLTACEGVLHSVMSGSGATCVGLFGSSVEAERAARDISDEYPRWWCVATALGDAAFDLSSVSD